MSYRAHFALLLVALTASLLSACAQLTVTRVKPGDDLKVVGVRYYLPKPFIIFAPQADGTVCAQVVYLPDKSREYAIDATSNMSSYAFQASTDQSGLLTSVQYNADTTAVAAQTAASVGSGIAAGFNYETARAAAVQTQVNTAQTNLIAAQSAYQSALAALNSDNQANAAVPNTVSASAIQTDASTLAQRQAALQVAQAALQTAQSTPQAVTGTAAAGTPVTTTPAAAGTAFTAPGWSQGTVINLPQQYGPLWFAVNDNDAGVSLKAVKSEYPNRMVTAKSGSPQLEGGAQPAFATTLLALGPPQIPVPIFPFAKDSKLPAVFTFNRTVKVTRADIAKAGTDQTPSTQPVVDQEDGKTLVLDISKLKPGAYWLEVHFTYPIDPNNPKDMVPSSQKFLFAVVARSPDRH